MQRVGEFWRVRFFFRRGEFQRDLKEEMDEHVRMKTEDQRGKRKAKRAFGNALLFRERSRDVWGFAWLETLLQDVRCGLRRRASVQFTRHPLARMTREGSKTGAVRGGNKCFV